MYSFFFTVATNAFHVCSRALLLAHLRPVIFALGILAPTSERVV